MKKAPDAFRTISEVSDILNTPAHVLRFWESKFYQIRPVKRAGGRRYYRPDDVALINGVRHLLQDQGMTIRGVQRILQENGIKHVVALGTPVPTVAESAEDTIDAVALDISEPEASPQEVPASVVEHAEDAQVVEETPAILEAEQPDDIPEAVAPSESMLSEAEPPAPPDEAKSDSHAEPVVAEPVVPEPVEAEAEIAAIQSSDTAPETAPAVSPSATKPPKGNADMTTVDLPEIDPTTRADETGGRPSFASQLRSKPRGDLGADVDRYARLSRRIEALLDRMSEASGAGRW